MSDLLPQGAVAPLHRPDPARRQPAPRRGRAERSTLFVGSVEKAFQVLEAFRGSDQRMSMAEIARAAGLDRSSTQRLVHTMEQLGYIRRMPESLMYGLTPKVLQPAYNYLRSREIIDRASPYLVEMSHTLGETSNLQELDGHEIVFIARFPGRHLLNIGFAVGSRLAAVFSASGRVMLSKLSTDERLEVIRNTPLAAVTPVTETDPDRLMQHIADAERQGYAITQNQTVLGDISLAAAITDHRGRPVGAINISVPSTRWTVERAKEVLLPHVLLAATAISQAKRDG